MTLSIGSLFTLIIVLLVIGILVWLAFYVLRHLGPPDPVNRILQVVIVVVAVLLIVALLLNLAGISTGVKFSETLGSLINNVG